MEIHAHFGKVNDPLWLLQNWTVPGTIGLPCVIGITLPPPVIPFHFSVPDKILFIDAKSIKKPPQGLLALEEALYRPFLKLPLHFPVLIRLGIKLGSSIYLNEYIREYINICRIIKQSSRIVKKFSASPFFLIARGSGDSFNTSLPLRSSP